MLELNALELKFLMIMDFSLFVDLKSYAQVYDELCHPSLHLECGFLCKARTLFGAHPPSGMCIENEHVPERGFARACI